MLLVKCGTDTISAEHNFPTGYSTARSLREYWAEIPSPDGEM